MPQDLIDARFFSDNEIRKLVDEINGEFARLNIESPFKDIDVSNGKELSKETKAILNDAKELEKVIGQISVAGASVRDNLTDERAIIEVQRKTETAIKQVKLLAKSYNDVQKEVENILNTDHVVGFSVQGEDGQSIGEMGEQAGREFREGLESELNAYRGEDILKQTIFKGVDNAFSKYGADFDDIISKALGNSKFDFHDLVMRALYSNILESIGGGQGIATYERLSKDSVNYSTKRDRVYIPDEVLDDAIEKGTLRKGGYFKNKGAMTASDTVMPMRGENIIEGQGFLEQMERIATSYARLDEIASLLNSAFGEDKVQIHNPFRKWDAGESIGAYSDNVDLMTYLFEEGGYDELIDELKPLRANLIRAIKTALKDPNNNSGITKITYQEAEDLIDELSGKNNDNPIYNARTGLRYVNKAINKGHFNSLIDEEGNITGNIPQWERNAMRAGVGYEYSKPNPQYGDEYGLMDALVRGRITIPTGATFEIPESVRKDFQKKLVGVHLSELFAGVSPSSANVTLPGGKVIPLGGYGSVWMNPLLPRTNNVMEKPQKRPVMSLTDVPNISDLEGVDPNKYGEEMVDIIGKWFYRVAPQYSDAISRWITIWGNRLPDPDIKKKDFVKVDESEDIVSNVKVYRERGDVPNIGITGAKYSRSSDDLGIEGARYGYEDETLLQPWVRNLPPGVVLPLDLLESYAWGDLTPYKPNEPTEIDGTQLTAEELQSILGDGVIIKDVSNTTREAIKSGMADDFFGNYHDENNNEGVIDEEEFWKRQWESFQKIADIFKITQIVNLLQKINERIYVFGTNTSRALSSIKESIDNVDVKLEIPSDANITINQFPNGAKPQFNIPNPFFDENGENVFLKMMRDGFGVVNGNEQQNKKLKKYRQSYNNSAEWEDYNERVDKLSKLSKSDNPEYRAFAEYALSEAKSMRDKGFNDRVRNQDLFMGLFEGKLPDMENFSFEDYGKFAEEYDYYMKTWNVVSHYTYEQLGEEIAKVNKQIAELESTGPSGDKGGMNNLQIEDKLRELNARKNDLLSNYNKFLLDEDELIYLEMMVKVYGSLLRGRAPYGKYKKRLESFLTLVNKGEFEASKQMSARIAEMEIGLKSIGADVSDIISKVLEKTNADLDEYRKELKSAKSGSAKKTLEKQIKALEEFKTHLENLIPDEGILPGYVSEYPNVFNPSTLNSAKMYEVVNDYAHGEGVGDHALNVSRFGSAVSQYSQLKQQIKEQQYLVTIEDVPKETIESYNSLVERFKKIHDVLFNIVQEAPEFKEYFRILTVGYNDVALSAEALIEKTKELGNVSRTNLQALSDSNRKGLTDLFGGSIKWDETGNAIANVGKQSTQATSNFTKFTQNFDRATRAITGAGGALTWFFSIVGSGQALNDMVTASSLRQTNQIMLSARRGTEEATKLYDRIQMLVVKLPGNDTFLTNILTMLGTMDKSLSAEDLEYMGGVIADYYMGAQAKGQFNNETERELRNYLMTGQTRNLTNSIIASEIESLKGLNSVKERTVALEKALQKTGMDSIAHYDSYTNTFEEFKGRFQKSFADWGDLWLGFLQLGMKIYNTVDSLTGSALSQATIALGVLALGFVSLIGIMGTFIGMLGQVVGGIEQLQKFMIAPFKATDDPYTVMIKESVIWILYRTKLISKERYEELRSMEAKMFNAEATNIQTTSTIINTEAGAYNIETTVTQIGADVAEADAKLVEAGATDVETASEATNIGFKNLSFVTRMKNLLLQAKDILLNFWEAFSLFTVADGEIILNKEKYLGIVLRLDEYVASTLSALGKLEEGGASLFETYAESLGIKEKLIDIATRIWRTAVIAIESGALYGLAIAGFIADIALSPVGLTILTIVGAGLILVTVVEKIGEAFGWWTDFGSMFEAIGAGINRVWEAFWNNKHIQDTIYIVQGFLQNLMAFLDMTFLGGIWEMIFGTGGNGEWDIVEDIINVLGSIGEFLWWISSMDEILEILRSVGALMGWIMRQWNDFVQTPELQQLIDDFQEVQALIGAIWDEVVIAFNGVGEAWAELWGDDESARKFMEDGNELLELLKDIASFIHDYIIPILKVLVPAIVHGVLDKFILLAKFIKWVIDGIKWIGEHLGMQNDKKPTNIANQPGGYNKVMEDRYKYDYSKASGLAKSYINNNNGQSTIINNNFSEGSVQADARNMTAKDVTKMFTTAFGYNQTRGVKGVLR